MIILKAADIYEQVNLHRRLHSANRFAGDKAIIKREDSEIVVHR